MSGRRSRTVEAGGPLHYLEWDGPSDATVVCIHGVGANAAIWDPIAERLSALHRTVALDLPGHGRSPRAGRSATLGGARQALARFLDALDVRPAFLLGASFGGAVAATLAAEQPASVRGLVLSSSYHPPVLGGRWTPLVVGTLVAEQLGGLGRRAQRRLAPGEAAAPGGARRRSTLDGGSTPWYGPDFGGRRSRWVEIEGMASLAAFSIPPARPRSLFERIRCPVLVLHGEEDPIVPVGWARVSVAREPHWELRTFPAVSHLVKLGRPELWLDDVGGWLDGLAQESDTP